MSVRSTSCLLLPIVARTRSTPTPPTARRRPIWWAVLTLVVGDVIGPIAMCVFFLQYAGFHLLEAWWTGGGVDAGSRVSRSTVVGVRNNRRSQDWDWDWD